MAGTRAAYWSIRDGSFVSQSHEDTKSLSHASPDRAAAFAADSADRAAAGAPSSVSQAAIAAALVTVTTVFCSRRTLMKTRIALISVALAGILVGCAQPPTVELDASKQALDTAKAAQAETYAPAAAAEAQQALAAAEAEIAAQAEKLAFLRKYDTANQLIAEANTKAEAARQAAIDGKAAAQAAAEAAVAGANDAVTGAQALLASLQECPKKPKDFASQVELLSGTLTGLATRVGELSSLIASEQFSAATEQANALSGEVAIYSTDLEAAKVKLNC